MDWCDLHIMLSFIHIVQTIHAKVLYVKIGKAIPVTGHEGP
jgi:hypothetical protein